MVGEAAEQRVDDVLDLLVELRDLEEASVFAAPPLEPAEVEVDGDEEGDSVASPRSAPAGRYLVPALPRLVDCGALALVSGPIDAPHVELGDHRAEDGPESVARWTTLTVVAEDERAARGIGLWSLRDWLGPPEHQRCQRRWATRLDPEREAPALGPLPELWRLVDAALDRLSMPVTDDAGFWVLAGRPGARFGRPGAPGRWVAADQAPDGRWCAVREGYREGHWRAGAVEVRGGAITTWLDLYDWDELCWAHLSRAARTGPREIFSREGDELRLTTPLPRQLRRLGALGSRQGWRWRSVATDAVARELQANGLALGVTKDTR